LLRDRSRQEGVRELIAMPRPLPCAAPSWPVSLNDLAPGALKFIVDVGDYAPYNRPRVPYRGSGEQIVPRKKSPHLTEAEQRLMEVLWKKGSATVAEVTEALPKKLGLAYNTVLTTLRILEEKGYLRHSKPKDARAFIYTPVVSREEASQSALQQVLRRFFGNSPGALVLNLLEDENISDEELKRIRELLKPESSEQESEEDEQ
jgi:predicted transcriptional regulator